MDFILSIFKRNAALSAAVVAAAMVSSYCAAALVGRIAILANLRTIGTSHVLAYVLLTAGFVLTRLFVDVANAKIATTAIAAVREALVRTILRTPLEAIERIGTSNIYMALAQDVESISTATKSITAMAVDASLVFALLLNVGRISWSLFALSICVLIVGFFLSVPGPITRRLGERKRETNSLLMESFHALSDGAKELKLNAARREVFSKEEIGVRLEDVRRASFLQNLLPAFVYQVSSVIGYFTIGGVFLCRDALRVTDSTALFEFALTFAALVPPMTALGDEFRNIVNARVAIEQLNELGLSVANGPSEPEGANALLPPHSSAWKELRLLELEFAYASNGDFKLGPIDLTLKPGQISFIVGGNGSGKSTLAKLITGLYAPTSGEIWLDGKLVTDQNLEEYRNQFSAIFIDFYLEKKLPPSPLDRDRAAKDLLVSLGLERKVQIKDGAFSTIDLSSGQRKRLALIASYLEDRPIYLFDEWTADQDPTFKRIFYMELLPALKARGKCVIAITHDDRYFSYADQIIKLENGILAGEATDQFAARLLIGNKVPS